MTGSIITAVLHQLLDDRADSDRDDHLGELIRRADPLLPAAAVDDAAHRIRQRLEGLGPIAELLDDPAITDLMINGDGSVWTDRGSGAEPSGITLSGADVTLLIERILAPLGRRVNPVDPVVDGRLDDGSRVHVVVPPLAVDGPCITIRRFGTRSIPLDEIAAPPLAELLVTAVRSRTNIVVSGGTGSGKTTLLNALAAHVDDHERLVTIEDAAELRLGAAHVIRLETRRPGAEGLPGIDARELVRNALRMRPDRVLLGEVRGPEALDLVQAMNTGHDGALSTVHANGCEDALRRLETLVLLAGVGLPLDAVRDHLAAAIDLIVHIVRWPDGTRRIAQIGEVLPPGHPGRTRIRTLAEHDRVIARPERWPLPETASGASPCGT